MRILALDVGAASITSAIIDTATAQVIGSSARVEYNVDRPTSEAAEIPAERLWSAVTGAARAVAQALDGIKGVGISVLTPALVLLNEKDQPAAPVRFPSDRRSRTAARQVQAEVGLQLLAEAGNRPLPGTISAISFRQMVTDDPYLIREVRRYLHLNGWLALRMTGDTAFDPANASLSGLYGTLTTRAWSQRWCEYFEVESAWLPPILDARATVGTIRPAVAAELGVPAGIPLKLGSSPICTMMLAAGMAPGDLLHSIADTQLLSMLTDRPGADRSRLVYQHGIGGYFVHEAHNPLSGTALHWLRELCFRDQSEQEFVERTIPQAREHTTRVTLDPPFLAGDCLEIEAHRAAFRDLTLATDRLDLLAALVQEMRRQHERALAALGQETRFQRLFQTGASMNIVRRILPDYIGAAVSSLPPNPVQAVASLFNSR
jgi:xylulokinase